MKHFKKISDLHEALNVQPPEHPLFSVAYGEQDNCTGNRKNEFSSDFYHVLNWFSMFLMGVSVEMFDSAIALIY